MDKSIEYAQMCASAEEIQIFRAVNENSDQEGVSDAWEAGDFYSVKMRVFTISEDEDNPPAFLNPVWLPRQDQLQDYIVKEYVSVRKMMVAFGQYCEDYGDIKFSGEQLWLSFIMKNLYNKEWDGVEWIAQ